MSGEYIVHRCAAAPSVDDLKSGFVLLSFFKQNMKLSDFIV
jgi:hypothetical protein